MSEPNGKIEIDLALAKVMFSKRDLEELKEMLRLYQDAQEYEFCELIQKEIDSRVNA